MINTENEMITCFNWVHLVQKWITWDKQPGATFLYMSAGHMGVSEYIILDSLIAFELKILLF